MLAPFLDPVGGGVGCEPREVHTVLAEAADQDPGVGFALAVVKRERRLQQRGHPAHEAGGDQGPGVGVTGHAKVLGQVPGGDLTELSSAFVDAPITVSHDRRQAGDTVADAASPQDRIRLIVCG